MMDGLLHRAATPPRYSGLYFLVWTGVGVWLSTLLRAAVRALRLAGQLSEPADDAARAFEAKLELAVVLASASSCYTAAVCGAIVYDTLRHSFKVTDGAAGVSVRFEVCTASHADTAFCGALNAASALMWTSLCCFVVDAALRVVVMRRHARPDGGGYSAVGAAEGGHTEPGAGAPPQSPPPPMPPAQREVDL